jgi:aryl-alcohol dehydrogenase-like predicted oxidoreductase
MKFRTLGRTGVEVSELCLGAMMFGVWGNPDHDDSVRIIRRALEGGINFIDTADVYSAGESEKIVGKALAEGKLRRDVVLATKAHGQMGTDRNARGNSRRWITAEVENSLRRLGTDYIDLYQIHRPDPTCDVEETLSALTDLVRAGKIRYFGSSTFPAHEIVEAQWVADRRNLGRFVCEQPPYSILARGIERDVLPVAQKYGMGVIPWSPLNGGFLSGRYRTGVTPEPSHRDRIRAARGGGESPAEHIKREAAELLGDLAEKFGLTVVDMALAFVLDHPAVTAAIIGPRTMEQLESQLSASEGELPEELLDAIDAIVPPGVNLDPGDAGWEPPSLQPESRRR